MASISLTRPPFAEASNHLLPNGWCVLSHPDEAWIGRIGETITRVEGKVAALLEQGAKEFQERVTEPGPEVWVYKDLGAVWAGYQISVDGREVGRGVNLFGLHRKTEGWKISGIADTQAKLGAELEQISKVAPPSLMAPIDDFLQSMTNHKWEKMLSYCLRGGGITNSRRSMDLLVSSTWPELIARLKSMMDGSPPRLVYEILFDIEARVCGNIGFLWTPFKMDTSGQTTNKGVNIFTLVPISGCQDTSMPIS